MTTASSSRDEPSYWSLVAAGEPFRLLFPIGLVLGIVGVAIWPLFVVGWWPVYPAIAHPRIMIEGFLTAFVIGFLGTALPRLLEVRRISLRETLLAAALLIGVTLLHLLDQTLAADFTFIVTLALGIFALGSRWSGRQGTPPPGFVLVALGLVCALAGAALLSLTQTIPLPQWAYSLGPLLLFQGYLLLPIMGVGAFLLPRFFGLDVRAPTSNSRGRLVFPLACGFAIVASFIVEATGAIRLGCFLRAITILLYFWREIPMHQARFRGGTLAASLRLALLAIPVGYVLIAGWPTARTAWLHVVFITGFSLLVFTVASRIVLGHSGQSARFCASVRPVLVMTICLIGATVPRITADFFPDQRLPHFAYAAVLWMIGATVWGFGILPAVRHPDDA